MTKADDYIKAAEALDYANKNQSYLGLNLDNAVARAIELLKQAAEYRKAVDTLMAISDALGDEDD